MVQTNMAVPKDSALPGSLVLGLYPTAMERYPTTGPPKMLPQVSATVLHQPMIFPRLSGGTSSDQSGLSTPGLHHSANNEKLNKAAASNE